MKDDKEWGETTFEGHFILEWIFGQSKKNNGNCVRDGVKWEKISLKQRQIFREMIKKKGNENNKNRKRRGKDGKELLHRRARFIKQV